MLRARASQRVGNDSADTDDSKHAVKEIETKHINFWEELESVSYDPLESDLESHNVRLMHPFRAASTRPDRILKWRLKSRWSVKNGRSRLQCTLPKKQKAQLHGTLQQRKYQTTSKMMKHLMRRTGS